MKRVNGFIDLNEALEVNSNDFINFEDLSSNLKTLPRVLNLRSRIDRIRGKQLNFEFINEGIKYYFKYDENASPYNELIAEEIAHDIGIPSINYELAQIGPIKGNISADFKKSNAKYIDGEALLRKYHGDDIIFKLHNTHKHVREILTNYYQNYPNSEIMIKNIMDKLALTITFDILTGQSDRTSSNWIIVEYPNGLIDLNPLFDNIRILMRKPSETYLVFGVDGISTGYLEDIIERLTQYRNREYANLLPNYLWVISEDNLEKIFTKVEKRTGISIQQEIKEEYLRKFKLQREFITTELKKLQANDYKYRKKNKK